jgi:hypothetical protein
MSAVLKARRTLAVASGRRRGVRQAAKVVFIGDSAACIWELARVNFPAAIFILDLYHALERLHELCDGLYGQDSAWAGGMAQTLADERPGGEVIAAHHRLQNLQRPPDEPQKKQLAYFEHTIRKRCS